MLEVRFYLCIFFEHTPFVCDLTEKYSNTSNSLPNLHLKKLISFVCQKQEIILIKDVSLGKERNPVPLIVPAGCSFSPPDFGYIKESMVLVEEGSTGELWTSVGNSFKAKSGCTDCGTDCLASDPAACTCALQSGSFAYTKKGTLKAVVTKNRARDLPLEFCDKGSGCYCSNIPSDGTSSEESQCFGHRPRLFISECNSKCACHSHCGNRVIQHGMKVNVQVQYNRHF